MQHPLAQRSAKAVRRRRPTIHLWFGVATLLALSALAAPSAQAYYNTSSCSVSNAQVCWSGDGYHTNIEVDAFLLGTSSSSVCAKAVTAAGNTRTGSGCTTASGTTYRISCISDGNPASAAYGYWADGSGGTKDIAIYNFAGSDRAYC